MAAIANVSVPPAPSAPDTRNDPGKIENAAKQFESLLISQILKSMHEEGSGGWLGTGDDTSATQPWTWPKSSSLRLCLPAAVWDSPGSSFRA